MLLSLILLASSPMCTTLHHKFEAVERGWGYDYVIYNNLAKAARKYAEAVPGHPTAWADARKAAQDVITKDKENQEDADRIVALMVSYKCTLPDHLASPLTYPPPPLSRPGTGPSKE